MSTATVPLHTRLKLELVLHDRRANHIARDVGISVATLSRILAGKQQPSADLLQRIEAAIRGGDA